MILEVIIVEEILWSSALISAIAEVTTFVLLSTMCIELIVAVKSDSAESALGMSLESTLIGGSGVVVSRLLVLSQFGKGEKLMFVSEDFLIART